MKSTKSLLTALVLLASVFTSCIKEEITPGIDKNKPAPKEFMYDEVNSSAKALAVYWDAADAVAAGATSFTVQLPTELNNGDNYDTDRSVTLTITDDVYDAAIFSSKLNEYEQYYVRVRANYPYSVYSEWVYLTLDGEPAKFEVGHGFYSETLPTVDEAEYSPVESTNTKMAFDYNAASADAKQAELVRVQLLNTSTGKIEANKEYTDFPSGVAAFDGLKAGKRYKVRARAEYAGTAGAPKIVTKWVNLKGMALAAGETTERETSIFEVGKGAVIVQGEPPTVKLVFSSSSTLTFSWSTCEFTSKETDMSKPYNVQLYKDKECNNLVVSWLLDADNSNYGKSQLSFLFSGLEQNTSYWFVVTDESTGVPSEAFEAKTKGFNVVTVGTTPVEVGGYALAEDFSEFVWGGDYLHGGIAYSSNGRSSTPTIDKAEGVNPVGAGSGFYLIPASTEMGLFNTLDDAIPSTRLATWGGIFENSTSTTGYICVRSGHLKLGASKYTGDIATPILSNLKETATVEISFDAAKYDDDPLTMSVKVIRSATVNPKNALVDVTADIAQEFELKGTGDYEHFAFEIKNVSPTDRLAIAARRVGTTPGSDQHRFFLDNVQVKVVSYGSVGIELAAPVLETTADDKSITLTWNAVDKAQTYTVEYKKHHDTEWIVVEGLTETTYTIEGLEANTAYSVRVKAVAGDSSSDYATPAIITLGKASFPITVKTADQLITLFESNDLITAGPTDEVILGADIDMTGKTLVPAATFKGILNGQGNSIKNWNTTTPLFETLAGTVKDLVIDASCVITPGSSIFGIIAKNSEGTLSNVINRANISYVIEDAASDAAILIAPFVGYSKGKINGCTNYGDVTVKSQKGLYSAGASGIAALQAGVISNCTNNGKITLESLYTADKSVSIDGIGKAVPCLGGVVAFADDGFEMNYCNNNGAVLFKQTSIELVTTKNNLNRHLIGGIVGAGNGNINNCINSGDVTVIATTTDRSAYAAIEYNFCTGGICGGDYFATGQQATSIINCQNKGKVTVDCDASKSYSTAAGIVGWPGTEDPAVTNKTEGCLNTGDIFVSGKIKGRFGGIHGGTGHVVNCINEGNVTTDNIDKGSAIGLLLGNHSQRQKIESCSTKGTLTVKGANTGGVGALVGNQGNADQQTTGQITIDAVINAPDAEYVSMITGLHNKLTSKSRVIVWGSESAPIKVKGSVNGTVLDASNYSTYCECHYASGSTVFATIYAQYWN